jgi:hypothetical protein
LQTLAAMKLHSVDDFGDLADSSGELKRGMIIFVPIFDLLIM